MGRIDIIANDGSPLGVTEKSIHGEDGRLGIGGAELALLTLCKGWHDAGHKVVLYNSPDTPDGSCFEQRGIDEFSPHSPRDILIIFRSPNMRIRDGAQGLKVWFSCDQSTIGDFKSFSNMVDKIVTISSHHSKYFREVYGIFETISIDLPVRTWEYDLSVEKKPYQVIWNSIPDRGALELAQVWGKVVSRVPEAQLVITSDWRLWNKHISPECTAQYRAAFAPLPNVTYLGAVTRKELIRHELESQIHLNPNVYEELFCIAIAETQVAGAYPVSSTTGALDTTNMGQRIEGSPRDAAWHDKAADIVVQLFEDEKQLRRLQNKVQHKAINRFSLNKILELWDKWVFNG